MKLHAFMQAAEKKAKAGPVQPEYTQYSRRDDSKLPLEKICEECLSMLTDEERAELDRIVEKLSGAVTP